MAESESEASSWTMAEVGEATPTVGGASGRLRSVEGVSSRTSEDEGGGRRKDELVGEILGDWQPPVKDEDEDLGMEDRSSEVGLAGGMI
jgi:hypothetical protein